MKELDEPIEKYYDDKYEEIYLHVHHWIIN